MKIAIISDIHENFHNLALFLEKAKTLRAEKILCLGDLINGGIARCLALNPIDTFMIWGNNDGDKVAITKTSCAPESHLKVAMTTYEFLELDGKKIFLTHYPELAHPIAKSGDFDLVCYGHTHRPSLEKIGNTVVVNPGSLGGERGSFSLYDTQTHTLEMMELEVGISLQSDLAQAYLEKLGVYR